MIYLIPSEFRTSSGIYIIKNTVSSKVYIGSAVHFQRRFCTHRWALDRNRHHSILLQRFVNKYGLESMSFELLEVCSKDDLVSKEQYYLDLYKSFDPNLGFNIKQFANSSLGYKASEETRLKLSKSLKGKKKKYKDGVVKGNPFKKGHKPHHTKHTPKQVMEIRNLFLTHPARKLALMYDCTLSSIQHIIKGRSWPELPMVDYSNRKRMKRTFKPEWSDIKPS